MKKKTRKTIKHKKIYKIISTIIAVALMTTTASAWTPDMAIGGSETSPDTSSISFKNIPNDIVKNVGLSENADIVLDDADADSLNTFTTVNADGTKSCYSFNEPIKFIDKNTNEIKFIDNSLKKNEEFFSSTAYTNAEGETKLSLAKKATTGAKLECGDETLKLRPVTEVNSKAELRKFTFGDDEYEVVEYKDIFGTGAHLQYASETGGIKENIYLENYTGTNEFVFELDAKGVVPDVTESDAITFVDETSGDAIFMIEKAWAMDSYDGEYREDETHFENDNLYRVEKISDGKFKVTMIINKDFLEDENTVYPVLIDPTLKYNTIGTWAIPYTVVFSNGHRWYPYRDTCVGQYPYPAESIMYAKITNINDFKHINPYSIQTVTVYVHQEGGCLDSYDVMCYDSLTTKNVADVSYSDFVQNGAHTSNVGAMIDKTLFSGNENYGFWITGLFESWLKYALKGYGGVPQEYGFIIEADQYGRGYKQLRCEGNYLWIKIDFDDGLEEGVYFIRNKDSNLYLTADATTVWQSHFESDSKHRWRIAYQGEGRYRLYTERYSLYEKCLAADGNHAYTRTSDNTDYFYIIKNATSLYTITDCNHPNSALYCETVENNASILQAEKFNLDDERWYFEKVDTPKRCIVGGTLSDPQGTGNMSGGGSSNTGIPGQWDSGDDDFSAWVNNDVRNACAKIGGVSTVKFKSIAPDSFIRYVKDSAYFAINAHGDGQGNMWCNRLSGSAPNYQYNESCICASDLSDLHEGYFSTTRCVLLSGCNTAVGGLNNHENMTMAIKEKGAWVVIGFSDEIKYIHGRYDVGAPLWNRTFSIALGDGKTVNEAINIANNAVRGEDGFMWGLNSICVAGDGNQVIRYS